MKLVEKINQLCAILSSDSVLADEVAIALGAIEEDEGEGGEIIVRPADKLFEEAVVVREDDSNVPAYIEFVLSRSGRVAVKELRSAFGDYSELPQLHWDSPVQIMFMVEQPGQAYGCAILAQYEPAGSNIEAATVSAITIRRDEL